MVEMRNILIVFMLVVFSACKSDKMPVDNESVVDKDSFSDFDNIQTDSDISFSDFDTVDKDNETSDIDTDTYSVVCLDLRYNENTIKTNFPFKDKDGKPTFCRPGCDTPTETDPQCVRNIWEWDNWSEYQVYLEAQKKDPEQEWERECYPWPCKLPDMIASNRGQYGDNKCDSALTVNGFQANMGGVWTHGMSDGVAGMDLHHSGRIIEYSPEKDEFITIGQNHGHVGFKGGRYLAIAQTTPSVFDVENRSFVISVLRKNGKYYYELIYDNKNHNAFMSRPPFSGEKWVLIHICDGLEGSCDVKYAKAGVWEWQSLGLSSVYEGNIVGDHLTFMVPYTNPDRQIYYCDLSKYPKSYQDCYKVTGKLESGEAELGHSPRIDEDDENRLIYSIYNSLDGRIKEVVFKDGVPSETKEYTLGVTRQPTKVKGKLMSFTSSLGTELVLAGCWYRFDKEKIYCPKKGDWTTEDMFFSIFDGKWQIWKGNSQTLMRDWECYCEETGICPFEE